MGDKKYYIGICLLIVTNSLHVLFFENNSRYDVYLFYEHERYLTNILYDVSTLLTFTVLSYWLSGFKKAIFQPLFITSMLSWAFYFTVYWQKASLFLIPFYLCIAIVPRITHSKE